MAKRDLAPAARSPFSLAAGGVFAGLLAAMVLFAPARWAAGAVERATQGRVQLADARGTVWNGTARLVLTGGPGSVDAISLPGDVDWRLRPRWNGAALELKTPCCTPEPMRLRLKPGFGRTTVEFEDGRSVWPAALLAGLGTPWNTMQFEGDLALSSRGLSVEWVEGRAAVAGRAELIARNVSSRLSTLRPLGSYRITLQGGTTTSVQLDTLEGSLQLAGSGQWVGSRLRFTGTATAAPDREEALANLLNIIGRRTGARSIIAIG